MAQCQKLASVNVRFFVWAMGWLISMFRPMVAMETSHAEVHINFIALNMDNSSSVEWPCPPWKHVLLRDCNYLLLNLELLPALARGQVVG